jgi:competence protein ComEC
VLDRLTAHDTELFGTDVNGTVVVTTKGRKFEVTAEREGTPVPRDDRAQGDSTDDSDNSDADETGDTPSAHQHDYAPGDGSCADGQVDINSADTDALEHIVHINPDRADNIGTGRLFSEASSLSQLDGVGPARINDIMTEGIACAS